jgi:hypothetical protein
MARRSRTWLAFIISVLVLAAGSLWGGRAHAGANDEQARGYLDKATAAYALNRYGVAAENFEKAFELKPDPALLYNAAQSYRLAGNKERALELYESYLRVYGGQDKRAQVEARIKDLKQAIAHDKAVSTSPPYNTLPVNGGSGGASTQPPSVQTAPPAPAPTPAPPAMPPPVATTPPPPAPSAPVQPLTVAAASPAEAVPAASPPAAESSSSTLLTKSASPPADDDSLTKKPWFWVAVGGGVVAAAVVVVLLAAGGSEAAMPTIGRARGN